MFRLLTLSLLFLQTSVPPALVVGRFDDDYGSRHVITATEWQHGRAAKYHIVEWNTAKHFLVAENDAANPSDPSKWTRIDWVELPPSAGTGPNYTWAFCMTAFDAPTRAAATAADIARPETPRTGCNGFPFSRMRRADAIGDRR